MRKEIIKKLKSSFRLSEDSEKIIQSEINLLSSSGQSSLPGTLTENCHAISLSSSTVNNRALSLHWLQFIQVNRFMQTETKPKYFRDEGYLSWSITVSMQSFPFAFICSTPLSCVHVLMISSAPAFLASAPWQTHGR